MTDDQHDDDEEPVAKPPPVDFWPVAGAEGLPDEVKNGEIPEEEQ